MNQKKINEFECFSIEAEIAEYFAAQIKMRRCFPKK
jgi:hypothetical protein